jgi:hypothetical protein
MAVATQSWNRMFAPRTLRSRLLLTEISLAFKLNGKVEKPIAHFAVCARVGRKSRGKPVRSLAVSERRYYVN